MQKIDFKETEANKEKEESSTEPILLDLKQIASWQLRELTEDENGNFITPKPLIGLPSLQRGAVWQPNQVELLWDSILRGFPIGSLVVSPIIKSQATGPGKHAPESKNKLWDDDAYTHHLLDGQQRANAIALGFLDPFSQAGEEEAYTKNILWIDLDPTGVTDGQHLGYVQGFKNSTRSHLLRVTTLAHPWGFKVSDEREPQTLEHKLAKAALNAFKSNPDSDHGNTSKKSSRPAPALGWPVDANIPIPLAWALLELDSIECTDESQKPDILWKKLLDKCKKRLGEEKAAKLEEESRKEPGNPQANLGNVRPWAERAYITLSKWCSNSPPETTLPSHAVFLAHGLMRASRTKIIALQLEPSALKEPSRDESNSDVANVEHLFQRLNGGGTDLSANERAYSMIKAYWPGIEQTIQKISPRPPETQVALLGTRLALSIAEAKADPEKGASLPPQPSVSSLRLLATAGITQQKNNEREKVDAVKRMFELPLENSEKTEEKTNTISESSNTTATLSGNSSQPDNAIAPHTHHSQAQPTIKDLLPRVDDWFVYKEGQEWGLPPVLRSRLATEAPEVFLFLLKIVNSAKDKPKEEIRQKLLGLATAIHWFGLGSGNRERAVRWLWKEFDVKRLLDDGDDTAFESNLLNRVRFPNPQNGIPTKPAIAGIMSPKELDKFIYIDSFSNNSDISNWRWYDSLFVKKIKMKIGVEEENKNIPKKEINDIIGQYWNDHKDFIETLNSKSHRGSNTLLLMYAQRDQMMHYFPEYDAQDPGFWEFHNVPWDFDHLLQKDAYSDLRKENKYIKVYQEWGNTIANLHILPFEENRSRQNLSLSSFFKDNELGEDFLKKAYLLYNDTDNKKKDCHEYFSLEREQIRSSEDNEENAHVYAYNFVIQARSRLLRIYGNWFDTLKIGTMLQNEEEPEPN